MEKDVRQLEMHFQDLADKSYGQSIFTFSEFLGLSEQDIFHRMERDLQYASFKLWGGAENTDRVMVRFGSPEDLGYDVEYPIVCIHIKPLMMKFADKLTHRDFLGALMNLGIDRGTLGDIKVGDKEAYLFCKEEMAEYICQNLDQVKHTHVSCKIEKYQVMEEEKPKTMNVQVASLRADAVIAKVYNESRSGVLEWFHQGKVFLNGRLLESNGKPIKEQDVINVRGCGKFTITRLGGETRKGKLYVEVAVYA